MRRLIIGSAVALFVLGGAVAIAGPASAGDVTADAKIAKRKSGPYKTNDVYEVNGPFQDHEQKITLRVKPGRTKNAFLRIQNDAAFPGIVSLQAFAKCAGEGPANGLCIKWFTADGTQITDDVYEQLYDIQLVAGEMTRLRMRIKVKTSHDIQGDDAIIPITTLGGGDSEDTPLLHLKVV